MNFTCFFSTFLFVSCFRSVSKTHYCCLPHANSLNLWLPLSIIIFPWVMHQYNVGKVGLSAHKCLAFNFLFVLIWQQSVRPFSLLQICKINRKNLSVKAVTGSLELTNRCSRVWPGPHCILACTPQSKDEILVRHRNIELYAKLHVMEHAYEQSQCAKDPIAFICHDSLVVLQFWYYLLFFQLQLASSHRSSVLSIKCPASARIHMFMFSYFF